MPQVRTYEVRLVPATREDGCISFTSTGVIDAAKHVVEASTLPGLKARIVELAREARISCSPMVRVPPGQRKPPGFDRFLNQELRYLDFTA